MATVGAAEARRAEGWGGSCRRWISVALAVAGTIAAMTTLAERAEAAGADNFADATVITLGESTFGSMLNHSSEVGEPVHNGNSGSSSVWWRWQAPANVRVTLDGCFTTNDPDTVMAVYTGSALNALTGIASNDDGCGQHSFGSRLRFDATSGTTYRIALANRMPSQGGGNTYRLALHQTPANDDLADAETLTGQLDSASGSNSGATGEPGEPSHGGNGGRSLWYRWTAPSNAPAVVSTCTSNFSTRLAVYSSAVPTPGFGDLSSVGTGNNECGLQDEVEFAATQGQTYWIAVDGVDSVLDAGGAHGSVGLTVATPPGNDDYANRTTLSGLPTSATGDTSGATLEPNEPSHGSNERSVWFSWTAPSTGLVGIDACDSPALGHMQVDVYSDSGAGLAGLSPVASDFDSCAGGTDGRVQIDATSGTTYAIAVSSFVGGAYALNIATAVAPPADTVPPVLTGPTAKVKKKKATITFSATDPAGSGGPSLPVAFACKLDAGGFAPCTSPKTYKKLKPGNHKVVVRATDAAGNPASKRAAFKVKKKKRKQKS